MNQDEDHGVSRYSNIRILILLLHYIVGLYSNCEARVSVPTATTPLRNPLNRKRETLQPPHPYEIS